MSVGEVSCFSDPEVEGLADVARCLGPYVARGLALAREEAEEEVRSLHTQQQVRRWGDRTREGRGKDRADGNWAQETGGLFAPSRRFIILFQLAWPCVLDVEDMVV